MKKSVIALFLSNALVLSACSTGINLNNASNNSTRIVHTANTVATSTPSIVEQTDGLEYPYIVPQRIAMLYNFHLERYNIPHEEIKDDKYEVPQQLVLRYAQPAIPADMLDYDYIVEDETSKIKDIPSTNQYSAQGSSSSSSTAAPVSTSNTIQQATTLFEQVEKDAKQYVSDQSIQTDKTETAETVNQTDAPVQTTPSQTVHNSGDSYVIGEVSFDAAQKIMLKPGYAANVLVYVMQRAGFCPNAIIGCLSYVLQEGSGLSTFTYEAYWLAKGPGGVKSDITLDNAAWIEWLNTEGKESLRDIYYAEHTSAPRYSAIGIGLLADSDVWNYKTNADGSKTVYKVVSNATKMIQFAAQHGGYWQDPIIQAQWLLQRISTNAAWDLDSNSGVNPKTDNEISAEEYCARVLCGVGMPGWNSSTVAQLHSDSYRSHLSHIAEARAYYERYSGTTPQFFYLTPNSAKIIQFK